MTRVLVTGVGAVTPVGNDARSSWRALTAGQSGIGPVTIFDASPFPFAIAGEVKDFQPEPRINAKDVRHMDRSVQFAVTAALEALDDAGIDFSRGLGPSAGVVFGAGGGGYSLLEEQYQSTDARSLRRMSPFFLSNILPDASSGHIAVLTGASGPNMAVICACATGTAAIGEGAEIIRRGDAEVVIAGAAESALTQVLYGSFFALRAIATYDDNPATACRPFDLKRDGFVVSEGAGAVVLESEEHARRRGAEAYAEVAGFGSSNDAYDIVASEENGRGPVLAMEMALRKAAIDPTSVGYVNAHGTGTPMNDRVETLALKRVFAKHAYRLAISSTKSMTGHMMGAAGAVEAIVSVLALREGLLPPTMHYSEPDPECDLDYVPNQARPAPSLEAALSTSIGLGGHNCALVFKRP